MHIFVANNAHAFITLHEIYVLFNIDIYAYAIIINPLHL